MNNEKKKAILQPVSACPIWNMRAAEKVGAMVSEIRQGSMLINRASMTRQNDAIRGGIAAETFHAESFNLDAILKDKEVRAFTDQFANSPLRRNDPTHDIVVMKEGVQVVGAQSKYYKTAGETQAAFRERRDGVHHYDKTDAFIGPSDQIADIKASADRAANRNVETRPEVSAAAGKVRDGTSATLEADGAKSTALSKREAEQLGKGSSAGKDLHQNMQKGYLNKATLQQGARAAASAAVITAVTAGCINSFQCIQQVREGKMTQEEATRRILQETVIAAGDSALKAGTATVSVTLAARSLPGLFAGTAFKRAIGTGAVAGATVCAVDAVQCLVMFAAGEMSMEELESRTGKNAFQTGAGVVGGAIGTAIGSLGGPPGAYVGALVGSMITSLAMNIALDNHVERTFALNLTTTSHIVESGIAMHDTLSYLRVTQEYYVDFQKGLRLSEQHFGQQVMSMQTQSARLKHKINNL